MLVAEEGPGRTPPSSAPHSKAPPAHADMQQPFICSHTATASYQIT